MANTQKEQVAAFYEAHHSRGKYDYLYGGEDRKNLFIKLVGTGKNVLEVGCRAGNLTQHFAPGNQVVGVDIDRAALKLFTERLGCRAGNLTQHFAPGNQVVGVDIDRAALKLFTERLGCPGHWVDVDEEPLPFPDQTFDVVVFSEVMEHVRFPQKALAEIRRVLKPTGRLLGSVPNSYRLRNRLRFLMGRQYESDPSHLRQYSHSILRRELEAHFRAVEIHPVSGHLLGGGSTGIPVFPWLPFRVRALFALDLIFVGTPQ